MGYHLPPTRLAKPRHLKQKTPQGGRAIHTNLPPCGGGRSESSRGGWGVKPFEMFRLDPPRLAKPRHLKQKTPTRGEGKSHYNLPPCGGGQNNVNLVGHFLHAA